MTIPFVTSGGTVGLFNRIGKIGKLLSDVRTFQNTTFDPDIQALLNLYDGSTLTNAETDLSTNLPSDDTAARNGAAAANSDLVTLAGATIARMVWRDNPKPDRTNVVLALQELIRQMKIGPTTVKACTVTVTPTTGTNVGNGVCVVSNKRYDGLVQENSFAETGLLICTKDSFGNGATAGSETFQYQGQAAQTDPLNWEWPLGSAAVVNLTAMGASSSTATGSLISNGDFETFTTPPTPDGWVLEVGSGQFSKSVATFYTGLASLQLAGVAVTLSAFSQALTLTPQTQYAWNWFGKFDVVPAAGVLVIELVDGNGVAINDAQGVANQVSYTLSSFTTSFVARNGVFRTPAQIPAAGCKLRFRLTTALSAASNLFFDRVTFGPMSQIYTGGPSMSVFSGSTAFQLNDQFSIAVTNDRGGASNLNNVQTLFDRLFSMKANGLLLPSSGAPTITDGSVIV